MFIMNYLLHLEHFSFDFWETFLVWLYFKFEFEQVLNHREIINSNHGDVATLVEGYCSLIIRASQTTTLNANYLKDIKSLFLSLWNSSSFVLASR